MEISIVKGDFRIKGKQTAVMVGDKVTVGEFVIPGPGEYEAGGVTVIGLPGKVYRFNVDNVSVLFSDRKLTDEEKTLVGTVNILVAPAKSELEAELEPAYFIPTGETKEVSEFAQRLPKLVTSAEKLPETTTVVVLD